MISPIGPVLQVLNNLPRQQVVRTPDGCATCEHREESVRDGGWCYMFKTMPKPTCAQHVRARRPDADRS